MKYIIYAHKLRKDNRIYIGMTCQNPKKRWQRGLGYTHSSYFYSAIKKYGWDNFEHIILFKNLTKEEAERKEKELIKKYSANVKSFGFNIMEGGLHPTMPEEQKKKISNTEKGKIVSKETREKIKRTKRKKFLELGLTENQKQWYKRKTRIVRCVETNKIYKGQKELNNCGFNATNIYEVCYGHRKSANGYHWCFIKE